VDEAVHEANWRQKFEMLSFDFTRQMTILALCDGCGFAWVIKHKHFKRAFESKI